VPYSFPLYVTYNIFHVLEKRQVTYHVLCDALSVSQLGCVSSISTVSDGTTTWSILLDACSTEEVEICKIQTFNLYCA